MNLNVAPKLRWPADKVEAILIREAERARKSFAAYRRMMRPTMKWNWFTQELSDALQQFYQDMLDGKRPKLAIMAPPQSGKSLAAEDFVSWLAGNAPDMKTIYASHSENLGLRCNIGMQRMIESERYQQVFETTIGAKGWVCNSGLVEYVNKAGSFRNVTVNGGINGLELHLGILDDPVKDRADANSIVMREKIWDWYTDVFRPRFAANSGMLWVMTRWHLDDPLGRALAKEPEIKVLKFKAIAEHDEKHRKRGEALFPEFKPLAMLRAQQRLMSEASWEAEYQQEPYLVGGGMFPIEKLHIIPVFDRSQIEASVLAVDKAGTKAGTKDGDGACTAIVLMHKLKNGQFLIETVLRGRWGALEREQVIKGAAEAARQSLGQMKWNLKVVVEQEPGSGGKESAEATIRNLSGFVVVADRVTGEKTVRAEPFAAQVQGSNVLLVAGRWVEGFLEELEGWPFSKTLDQGDAASMAFSHLTSGPLYDSSYSGFS